VPLGIETLADTPGTGAAVERGRRYRVRLRLWLNKGQPIALVQPGAEAPHQVIDADGALNTTIEMHRGRTIPGFSYGMDGMRVGGVRKIRIPPNLAYGDRGIPGVVPANAVLIAQIEVIEPA
jgi:hypothetical protein